VRGSGHQWFDDDSGPMVRLYAMTRGRARPAGGSLDIIALVVANTRPEQDLTLSPEQATILGLCWNSMLSVAEIAARSDLPLNVVRILLADLLDAGHVRVVSQPASAGEQPDERILREVINGLRAL
jgi:Protein of unknown function (DUF742)